jgi:hypothetical protein
MKIYKLARTPEEIYRISPDFQAYVRGLKEKDLRASNEKEFLEKLNNLPNTELGRSIIKKLEKYKPS